MSATTTNRKMMGRDQLGRKVIVHVRTARTLSQAELARERTIEPYSLPPGLAVDSYGRISVTGRMGPWS